MRIPLFLRERWQRFNFANAISDLGLYFPLAWMVCFLLIPLGIILYISFTVPALAIPPFIHVFAYDPDFFQVTISLSFESYFNVIDDSIFRFSITNALRIATISALLTTTFGYLVASAINRLPRHLHGGLLLLLVLPFAVSFLVRVYSWIGLLKTTGIINQILGAVGLGPLDMLDNDFAILVGFVYTYLPFAVFPIYVAIERIPKDLREAAYDLGAQNLHYVWRVQLPLVLPGFFAAVLLVFIPISGDIIVPELLGGTDATMIGRTIWSTFLTSNDWPTASALSLVLLVLVIVPIFLLRNHIDKTMSYSY